MPLWSPDPSHIEQTRLHAFAQAAAARTGRELARYEDLWRWSVDDPEAFWSLVWDFCGVKAGSRGARVLVDAHKMPGARWFPDARLSFAENLLRRRVGPAAILAVGAPQQGRVDLTLSCDHRVVFGADAARFLATLAAHLASPVGL